MAASPVNPKSHQHTRSNSLPTRTHPLISEFNDQLSKWRDFEETSPSSTSICQKLNGLQDLHDCVDKLLLLPFTQALAQEQHKKWFNEMLDGSLMLLDVCGTAIDALLKTKECTRELQSTLRRRKDSNMEIAREVEKYLASRKIQNKALQKALKGMQVKINYKNTEDFLIIGVLKELEAVTLTGFETLLSFIAKPNLQSKSSSWSLVSKLVHHKRVVCESPESDANEFEIVDAALQSLISHKKSKSDYFVHIENVQTWLGMLESNIQEFEEELECLSRHLVKTRVSLLNILNH
ncbi:uncharacterized protein LOC115973898 [Quercus lobata]|uniref:uncharacterized protein LOC115973898 n=1 Tax=Quercus lobata TaxID=97700 RepID=UPI001246477E|nr:uncharacterized protein LOC115973898 [Quercus lobata]